MPPRRQSLDRNREEEHSGSGSQPPLDLSRGDENQPHGAPVSQSLEEHRRAYTRSSPELSGNNPNPASQGGQELSPIEYIYQLHISGEIQSISGEIQSLEAQIASLRSELAAITRHISNEVNPRNNRYQAAENTKKNLEDELAISKAKPKNIGLIERLGHRASQKILQRDIKKYEAIMKKNNYRENPEIAGQIARYESQQTACELELDDLETKLENLQGRLRKIKGVHEVPHKGPSRSREHSQTPPALIQGESSGLEQHVGLSEEYSTHQHLERGGQSDVEGTDQMAGTLVERIQKQINNVKQDMAQKFERTPEPETIQEILDHLDSGDMAGGIMAELDEADIEIDRASEAQRSQLHEDLKVQQSEAYQRADSLLASYGEFDIDEFNNLRTQYRLLKMKLTRAETNPDAYEDPHSSEPTQGDERGIQHGEPSGSRDVGMADQTAETLLESIQKQEQDKRDTENEINRVKRDMSQYFQITPGYETIQEILDHLDKRETIEEIMHVLDISDIEVYGHLEAQRSEAEADEMANNLLSSERCNTEEFNNLRKEYVSLKMKLMIAETNLDALHEDFRALYEDPHSSEPTQGDEQEAQYGEPSGLHGDSSSASTRTASPHPEQRVGLSEESDTHQHLREGGQSSVGGIEQEADDLAEKMRKQEEDIHDIENEIDRVKQDMDKLFNRNPGHETIQQILDYFDKGDETGETKEYDSAYNLLKEHDISLSEFNKLRERGKSLEADLSSAEKNLFALRNEFEALFPSTQGNKQEVPHEEASGLHGDSSSASTRTASPHPEQRTGLSEEGLRSDTYQPSRDDVQSGRETPEENAQTIQNEIDENDEFIRDIQTSIRLFHERFPHFAEIEERIDGFRDELERIERRREKGKFRAGREKQVREDIDNFLKDNGIDGISQFEEFRKAYKIVLNSLEAAEQRGLALRAELRSIQEASHPSEVLSQSTQDELERPHVEPSGLSEPLQTRPESSFQDTTESPPERHTGSPGKGLGSDIDQPSRDDVQSGREVPERNVETVQGEIQENKEDIDDMQRTLRQFNERFPKFKEIAQEVDGFLKKYNISDDKFEEFRKAHKTALSSLELAEKKGLALGAEPRSMQDAETIEEIRENKEDIDDMQGTLRQFNERFPNFAEIEQRIGDFLKKYNISDDEFAKFRKAHKTVLSSLEVAEKKGFALRTELGSMQEASHSSYRAQGVTDQPEVPSSSRIEPPQQFISDKQVLTDEPDSIAGNDESSSKPHHHQTQDSDTTIAVRGSWDSRQSTLNPGLRRNQVEGARVPPEEQNTTQYRHQDFEGSSKPELEEVREEGQGLENDDLIDEFNQNFPDLATIGQGPDDLLEALKRIERTRAESQKVLDTTQKAISVNDGYVDIEGTDEFNQNFPDIDATNKVGQRFPDLEAIGQDLDGLLEALKRIERARAQSQKSHETLPEEGQGNDGIVDIEGSIRRFNKLFPDLEETEATPEDPGSDTTIHPPEPPSS